MKKGVYLLIIMIASTISLNAQKCSYKIADFTFWYDILPQLKGYEKNSNVKINIKSEVNKYNYNYGQNSLENQKTFTFYNQSPSVNYFTTRPNTLDFTIIITEKKRDEKKVAIRLYNTEVKMYKYAYKIDTKRLYQVQIIDPNKQNDTIYNYEFESSGQTQWPKGDVSLVGFKGPDQVEQGFNKAINEVPDFLLKIETELVNSCMNGNLLNVMHHALHSGIEKFTFVYKEIKTKDPNYTQLAIAYEHITKAQELIKIHSKAKTIPAFYQADVKAEMKAAFDILKDYYIKLDLTKTDKTEDEINFEFSLAQAVLLTASNVGDYELIQKIKARTELVISKEPAPKLNILLGIETKLISEAQNTQHSWLSIEYLILREHRFGNELKQLYSY